MNGRKAQVFIGANLERFDTIPYCHEPLTLFWLRHRLFANQASTL